MFIKGAKLPQQKKKVVTYFFSSICSPRLSVFLPLLPKFQCLNFLDFWNPWRKSNLKNWYQIRKLLFLKGEKLLGKKKVVFRRILPYYQDFFGIGATIRIGPEMLCLLYAEFFLAGVNLLLQHIQCLVVNYIFSLAFCILFV